MQETNGLPCKPRGQTQIPLCRSGLQIALLPQIVNGQGSTHSLDLQVLSYGQSSSLRQSTMGKREIIIGCNWQKSGKNERKTYIQSTLGADCQPNFLGICILVCGLKFRKWHFCRRDQNHMGQHSSFQCRLQMWDTHHHVDIHQF